MGRVDHQDRERSTGDGDPAEHRDRPPAHRRGNQHRSRTAHMRVEPRRSPRRPQTMTRLCGCPWAQTRAAAGGLKSPTTALSGYGTEPGLRSGKPARNRQERGPIYASEFEELADASHLTELER